MGREGKGERLSGQPLPLSCYRLLLLFEFIFLRERMMDMKAGNIKQS
jgi:hypothetical protein